jgi:hypothetical protein
MVESQAMGDASAAVVSRYKESLETELGHHTNLISSHAALGIRLVGRVGARLAAVAVAAQVRSHNRERIGQERSDPMPAEVGLWITVQQQERRAFATRHQMNVSAIPGQRL